MRDLGGFVFWEKRENTREPREMKKKMKKMTKCLMNLGIPDLAESRPNVLPKF